LLCELGFGVTQQVLYVLPIPCCQSRVRFLMRRQTTQLQRKLDRMAGQIGQFGLAAALVSLLGMAVPFTYRTFVVDGAPWDVAFLGDYLHFLIQAITILVR